VNSPGPSGEGWALPNFIELADARFEPGVLIRGPYIHKTQRTPQMRGLSCLAEREGLLHLLRRLALRAVALRQRARLRLGSNLGF